MCRRRLEEDRRVGVGMPAAAVEFLRAAVEGIAGVGEFRPMVTERVRVGRGGRRRPATAEVVAVVLTMRARLRRRHPRRLRRRAVVRPLRVDISSWAGDQDELGRIQA